MTAKRDPETSFLNRVQGRQDDEERARLEPRPLVVLRERLKCDILTERKQPDRKIRSIHYEVEKKAIVTARS